VSEEKKYWLSEEGWKTLAQYLGWVIARKSTEICDEFAAKVEAMTGLPKGVVSEACRKGIKTW
jgi:hypothetical protein